GMAGVAILHEDGAPSLERDLVGRHGPGQRLAPPGVAAGGQRRARAKRRQQSFHPRLTILHSTPVPLRGLSEPLCVVMTPKSTMYSAAPVGSKRAATGRSSPPERSREAGPLVGPLLTAKSST